jgi:hypothetical protein
MFLEESKYLLMKEDLDTYLSTNPFESKITLYHGSRKKFSYIKCTSMNYGNRLNPKLRNSSYWCATPCHPIAMAFWWQIMDAVFKTTDGTANYYNTIFQDFYNIDVKEKEIIYVNKKYQDECTKALKKPIYLYIKTIDKKYVGRGQSSDEMEYTLDFDIYPDSIEKIYFKDQDYVDVEFVSAAEIKRKYQSLGRGKKPSIMLNLKKNNNIPEKLFYYDRDEFDKRTSEYQDISGFRNHN